MPVGSLRFFMNLTSSFPSTTPTDQPTPYRESYRSWRCCESIQPIGRDFGHAVHRVFELHTPKRPARANRPEEVFASFRHHAIHSVRTSPPTNSDSTRASWHIDSHRDDAKSNRSRTRQHEIWSASGPDYRASPDPKSGIGNPVDAAIF